MDLDSLEKRLESIEELLRMLLLTNVVWLTDGKYDSSNDERIKELIKENNLEIKIVIMKNIKCQN